MTKKSEIYQQQFRWAKRLYIGSFGLTYLVAVYLLRAIRSGARRSGSAPGFSTRAIPFRYTNLAILLFVGTGIFLSGCSRDPNVRKQKYYNSGLEYLKKGKPADAVIQFRNALKVDPRFAEAWTTLGQTLFSQRDYQDAYKSFNNAIGANPNYLP